MLRGKSGDLPQLVHAHPNETVREAIDDRRVRQLPVARPSPR